MRGPSFALGIIAITTVVCATAALAAGSAPAAHGAPSHAARAAGHDAAVVPFIDDAYTQAVAEARARKVPIFVEAWAPW